MSTTERKKGIFVDIRQVKRKDLPEIFTIEKQGLGFPCSKDNFISCLQQGDCSVMVAEHEGQVIGFMVYKFYKNSSIHLLNLIVAKAWRRQGVAAQMMAELIAKLSAQWFKRIIIEVRETNLPAQLLLRKCGFKAINVFHKHYDHAREDVYIMQYMHKAPPEKTEKLSGLLNRIINFPGIINRLGD